MYRMLEKYVKKGYLSQLIEAKKIQNSIHTVISPSTVRAHVIVINMGSDSSMMEVEPSLVNLIIMEECGVATYFNAQRHTSGEVG